MYSMDFLVNGSKIGIKALNETAVEGCGQFRTRVSRGVSTISTNRSLEVRDSTWASTDIRIPAFQRLLIQCYFSLTCYIL